MKCSVFGCPNSSKQGYLLHKYPRDNARRLQWYTNIKGKANFTNKSQNNEDILVPWNFAESRVCEAHFTKDSYTKNGKLLKKEAVPTLHLGHAEERDSSNYNEMVPDFESYETEPNSSILATENENLSNNIDIKSEIFIKEDNEMVPDFESYGTEPNSSILATENENPSDNIDIKTEIFIKEENIDSEMETDSISNSNLLCNPEVKVKKENELFTDVITSETESNPMLKMEIEEGSSESEDDFEYKLTYDSEYVQPSSSSEDSERENVHRGRKRYRDDADDDAPSVIDFHVSTLASTSGFKWSCFPHSTNGTRIPVRNIDSAFTPGPTQEARNADTPEKCFRLLFEDQIIDEIVKWTNQKIRQEAIRYGGQTIVLLTEPAEVCALLGVIIFNGCQKDNHLSIKEMWSPVSGASLYRAAMSEKRFAFLINCLRFDDRDTREERRQTDKFNLIRKIWDIFINNCEKMYIPSKNLTVDAQLLEFRERCPFRMYIANKPGKYGIKLVLAIDNESKYLVGAIPYLGKQGRPHDSQEELGHYFTKELTRPYHYTNRNVTTGYWFTSVSLVTDLLNSCGITFVGRLKANKKEVPALMREKVQRRIMSSAFLFTREMTLVSYIPSKYKPMKKLVLLLSSMHTQPTLGATSKPEIFEFYNHTKGGVETFDKMCASTSCGRKTRRWPLCVFYRMVDTCVINSWIIHSENMNRTGGNSMIRRRYMQELAMALIRPWAKQRLRDPHLARSSKNLISDVCNLPSSGSAAQADLPVLSESRGTSVRCKLCPKGADRKTRNRCHACRKPVCLSHIYPVCVSCA